MPVDKISEFEKVEPFIRDILRPAGRLTLFAMMDKEGMSKSVLLVNGSAEGEKSPRETLQGKLDAAVEAINKENIFVETTVIESSDKASGILSVIQTLKGMVFPPNSLLYALDKNVQSDYVTQDIIEKASAEGLGVMILLHHDKVGFSQERIVNLWVRKQSPNLNLAVLIALQLHRNWEGEVRILQVVDKEYEKEESQEYLKKLKDLMRIPENVKIQTLVGNFFEALHHSPPADLNIFGMQEKPDIASIRRVSDQVQTSVLFLRDSKHESALA